MSMATIAAVPFLVNNLSFSVGTDEYTAHLSQAEFQPTQPTASFTDIGGDVSNFGGASGWVLALAGAQDWDTVNSLSLFLNAQDGNTASVTLTVPGGSWAATVVCAAVNIGGQAGSVAAWSKTLQCKTKPVFTATP
jgi:hypothetical protein